MKRILGALFLAFGIGFGFGSIVAPDTGTTSITTLVQQVGDQAQVRAEQVATTAPATTVVVAESTLPTPEPVVIVLPIDPPTYEIALAASEHLSATVRLPSDCGLPVDVASSLPNAERSYRSGVHQGIDFICAETGRAATAALPGRVSVVVRSFREPTPADRNALLGVAAEIDRTPSSLLSMLFGNFVVVDHGRLDGIGHVVTVYAHLAEVDDSIAPGVVVEAGQRLGEVGNTGTSTASSGGSRPQSLHLHWEIHVDDLYLGAGLSPSETRAVYAALFEEGR